MFEFKFGKHYYSGGDSSILYDISIATVSAALGFGVALLVYHLTEKQKNRQKQKDLTSYLYTLIVSVVKTTRQQIERCESYIKEQTEKPFEVSILNLVASNDISRAVRMDSQGVFEAYSYFFNKESNWLIDYNKFYKNLDFISETKTELKRLLQAHFQGQYNIQLRIKSDVDEIPTLMSAYSLEIKNKLGDKRHSDPAFTFFEKYIVKYGDLTKEKANLNQYSQDLMLPILEEILESFEKEAFAEPLMKLCKNGRMNINFLSTESKNFTGEIKKICDTLGKQVKELEGFLEKINIKIR